MTDLQTASYLLINGFHWYLYRRLLTLFLGQRRVGCPAEAAGYLCAYVLNSLCFLLVGVPLLNLASSLLPLLLLSLLYRAPHWQRLWSALVIYAASFLLDTLVFLLMPAHTSQLGNLVSALLLFFMALVLEKRCPSSEKELQPDGPFYWFAVLLIPSTSIAMVILLFYFAHCPAWLSLLVDGMLILLNLLVFHLYRQVGRSYYAQYRARILEQQNQAYANEVALYQCGERELRTLRHDMRNHLAALHLLAGQQDTGALQGYLEQFSKCLEPSALWASSGNPELDSLINFKLAEARRAGAQVRAELRLPAGLSLPLFTVNTILGNLLDNAVEGLARCPKRSCPSPCGRTGACAASVWRTPLTARFCRITRATLKRERQKPPCMVWGWTVYAGPCPLWTAFYRYGLRAAASLPRPSGIYPSTPKRRILPLKRRNRQTG